MSAARAPVGEPEATRTPHPVALITGASRGLGLALARFLAGQGYHLVLTARGGEALRRAATELADLTDVVAVAGSVTDPPHRRALREATSGGLDVLVHNASNLGASPLPALAALPVERFREVLETNLVAPLALTQELLPALRARSGWVVSISSDAARGGYPGWGAYGASKAALDLLTATLAQEEPGLAAVSVDPGDMRTRMHQDAFPGEDISDRPEPQVTLPFFAWLLSQPRGAVTGRRFGAQDDTWTHEDARRADAR